MALFPILFGLFGAVVASFISVLSERLYTGQSWVRSRSRCNSCARTLSARDLVPVLSWLISFGRCRSCGTNVPFSYALYELILAGLFTYAAYAFGISLALVVFAAALAVLLFIVIYDLRHTLVPPIASFLLAVLSVAFALLSAPSSAVMAVTLVSAGAIGLGFLALYVFSKGRAMGLGDAPVAFSLSLLVAPYAIPGLLFSFWIGALFGIAVLVRRRGGPTMGIEVPFVPFLAIGFLLAYFVQWTPW